jgi:hypothetical protein
VPLPKRSDWCFAEIRDADAARAAYLEDAPGFEEILSSIAMELARSLVRGQFFVGVDHFRDRGNQRVTLQFHVTPQLYDTFFNARTGYRAHYWASPQCGQHANAKLVQTLWMAMSGTLPNQVEARAIEVKEDGFQRIDVDTGSVAVARSLVEASFTHLAAKIWICERQMKGIEGPLKDIPVRDGLSLSVVRWKNAHAPLLDNQSTFLDLKGGFVGGEQSKDPWVRAKDIYRNGWS